MWLEFEIKFQLLAIEIVVIWQIFDLDPEKI